MATLTDYFMQAQLSVAAYATGLTRDIQDKCISSKLIDAGMSLEQAVKFSLRLLCCRSIYRFTIRSLSNSIYGCDLEKCDLQFVAHKLITGLLRIGYQMF